MRPTRHSAHRPRTSRPTEPDRTLIARAASGDERAFTRLVSEYEDLVYSFAFKVCRDKEQAEEAWQDTFVNVYRKLGQFDGKSKFSTWLYSIVSNNCLMKHRRRKIDDAMIRFDELPELRGGHGGGQAVQKIPSWKETPLQSVMSAELRSLLDIAIEKLPMEYRVVFILRDVEGRSAEETARIMELSVPAVKSRLRRARVFLREQLNGYMAQ